MLLATKINIISIAEGQTTASYQTKGEPVITPKM